MSRGPKRAGAAGVPAGRRRPRKAAAGSPAVQAVSSRELRALRAELDRRLPAAAPPRWTADPDDVQRSVARLVLSLVEFLRQLMERQAIRRMEAGTLSRRETEAVGRGLMELERTVREIAARFGLRPEDLNLDLGPLGRLT